MTRRGRPRVEVDVDRVLELLAQVDEQGRPLSLREIARRTGYSRRSLCRAVVDHARGVEGGAKIGAGW